MGSVCSTKTRCITRPSGPVWCVTSRIPNIRFAISTASAASLATLTPPPLPRPPAWICAFTTTGPPISLAAASTSSTDRATSPRGTGTPYWASRALA